MSDWIWQAIIIGGLIGFTIWQAIKSDNEAKSRRRGSELFKMMWGDDGAPLKSLDTQLAEMQDLSRRKASGEQIDFFTGGSGKTTHDPVVIHAPNSLVGIAAEYAWLKKRYGITGPNMTSPSGWRIACRIPSTDFTDYKGTLYPHPGKTLELFELVNTDGNTDKIHFDITSFF